MNNDIQALLDRIAAGAYTNADLAALRRALMVSGQGNLVQIGKYNVQIDDGQDIRIGDTIYQGPDAEAIREVLQLVLTPIQVQQERIAEGLKTLRAEMAAIGHPRAATGQTRVAGQRPQEVSDYFKDRFAEVNRVQRLLSKSTTRLVSIIGQGGIGKTALACKVLGDFQQQLGRAPEIGQTVDRIVYLSTRTAGISLERLFLGCAKLLDADTETRLVSVWTDPQLSATEKITQLLEALSEGTTIVLLDNLEDLLDGDGRFLDYDLQAFLEQTMESSAAVRLLITSRQALALKHQVLRFDQQVKLVDGLPAQEGVAMLRDLDPNGVYGLRDASDNSLAAAVERVHGVPRALEILAAILANDPLATLDDVLAGFYGHEDVVKGLIMENYRRLSSDAQRVMEALAVLRLPVPVVAVDYLLAPFVVGLDVPVVVGQLARTSIASIDRVARTITLHPIDQDYAYSQLPDEAVGSTGYTRHALERRAAQYYRELRTPEEMWKTIDDLAPQLVEFEHLVKAGEHDEACKVLDQIGPALHLWGYYDRLAQMRLQLVGKIRAPRADCENLRYLGTIYRALGLIDRSAEFYSRALLLARTLGQSGLIADMLRGLGLAESKLGHYPKAVEYFSEALDLARAQELTGDIEAKSRIGALVGHLGTAYHMIGKRNLALQFYAESLAIAQETGDQRREGTRLNSLGNFYRQEGELDKALNYYNKSMQIAEELGHERGRGNSSESIGFIHMLQRRWGEAKEDYLRALTIARKIGHRRGESHRLIMLGKISLGLGKVPEALCYCQEAIRLEIAENNHLALLVLGMCHLYSGDKVCGEVFSQAQMECQSLIGHSPDAYLFHYNLGTAYIGEAAYLRVSGNHDLAQSVLLKAMPQYERGMAISSTTGVLQLVLLDLELIQNASSEGLEPVFGLLYAGMRGTMSRGIAGNIQIQST